MRGFREGKQGAGMAVVEITALHPQAARVGGTLDGGMAGARASCPPQGPFTHKLRLWVAPLDTTKSEPVPLGKVCGGRDALAPACGLRT